MYMLHMCCFLISQEELFECFYLFEFVKYIVFQTTDVICYDILQFVVECAGI